MQQKAASQQQLSTLDTVVGRTADMGGGGMSRDDADQERQKRAAATLMEQWTLA
jgi:hypothetical protein